MAFQLPPGLNRPSSWPVRHQRRHLATTAFNAQVLESLATITSKVQSPVCEVELTSMREQIDKLQANVNLILQMVDLSASPHPASEDLEKRIASMELLLFRCTMRDFTQIDEKVTKSMPPSQPEAEDSPLKAQCLNFEIYTERGTQTQTSSAPHTLATICRILKSREASPPSSVDVVLTSLLSPCSLRPICAQSLSARSQTSRHALGNLWSPLVLATSCRSLRTPTATMPP
jgi:hypothetical protein